MDANGREHYAHVAELRLGEGVEPSEVGAAVTVALCGSWDHEGPCRWPNNHDIDASGAYRVLFVAPPADEAEVRARIETTLHAATHWTVLQSGPRPVAPDEQELATRLAGTSIGDPRLALVVVEHDGGIVLVHPPSGTPSAPASLPSGTVLPGESAEDGAVRLAREQTGLEVELAGTLAEFWQEGTPFGTARMYGYLAHATGGSLRPGDEGPAVVYPVDALPALIPVRAANRRVLDAYLER